VGPIAQSVEQRTFNPWVDSSSLSGPTFAFLFYSVTKIVMNVVLHVFCKNARTPVNLGDNEREGN